jgi:aryl-alcohol dehydrogenase-like predicted oxidoreductase
MTRGWQVNKEDARAHFALALETGVNLFHTADVYSVGLSEEITGHWLRENGNRDGIVVAKKAEGPILPGTEQENSRNMKRALLLFPFAILLGQN